MLKDATSTPSIVDVHVVLSKGWGNDGGVEKGGL